MSYKKSISIYKASLPIGLVALGNIINHILKANNIDIEPQDVLSVLMLLYGGYIGIGNWIRHREKNKCAKNPAIPR